MGAGVYGVVRSSFLGRIGKCIWGLMSFSSVRRIVETGSEKACEETAREQEPGKETRDKSNEERCTRREMSLLEEKERIAQCQSSHSSRPNLLRPPRSRGSTCSTSLKPTKNPLKNSVMPS